MTQAQATVPDSEFTKPSVYTVITFCGSQLEYNADNTQLFKAHHAPRVLAASYMELAMCASSYGKLMLSYLTLPFSTLPYATLPFSTLPYATFSYLALPYLLYATFLYPRPTLRDFSTFSYPSTTFPYLPFVYFFDTYCMSTPYNDTSAESSLSHTMPALLFSQFMLDSQKLELGQLGLIPVQYIFLTAFEVAESVPPGWP